jgi:predicted CxxxxCH...CXXCH cytochrome family protein
VTSLGIRRTAVATTAFAALLALAACDQARPIAGRTAGAGATGCTTCHGDASRAEADPLLQAAPPRDTSGGSTSDAPGVGAHQAHLHGGALRAGVGCGECHVVPTSTAHAGLPTTLTFGALASAGGATPAYAPATLTCATTYCHGATLAAGGTNQAPRWTGGPSQAACGTCHGAPPPSHAATSSDCSACHPGTVKPDGTIDVAGGRHVDGQVQVATDHPAGWADPAQHGLAVADQGLGSCRACHGADLAGGTSGVSCTTCHAAAGFADWQANCTFCHGTRVPAYTAASLAMAAPPAGVRGESLPTERAVGAHQRHLGGGVIGPAVACAECHAVPTDLTHLDGTPAVVFGPAARRGGATPSWNGDSCATSYCHGGTLAAGGSNQAPRWTGGPPQAACGTCHGAPPPSHAATSTTCSTCHPGTVRQDGTIDLAGGLHLDGTLQVSGGSCTSCHGLPPSTGRHGNHSGRSCGDCHPGYTRSTVNTATHADGSRQVGNLVTSWNPTTRACVGCHGGDTW